jgi:DNA ligase (NAD+)
MQKITAPTNCPSCQSVLENRNGILYCCSNTCGAKTAKSIEHWAKELKIKGLGPQTIKKLEITSIIDLYYLTESDLITALGSEKLGSKLYMEIEKSKQSSLNQVLPAFGIPLIGNSATKKLSSTISKLEDLTDVKAKEAGLGPKAVSNLMDWYNNTYLYEIKPFLPFDPAFDKPVERSTKKGSVCITGKVKSFKVKADAERALELAGYEVKKTATNVTYLVNESGIESAKTKAARASGKTTIITNLNQLLGD